MGRLSSSVVRRLVLAGVALLALVVAVVWMASPGQPAKKRLVTTAGPQSAPGGAQAATSQAPGGGTGGGAAGEVTGGVSGAGVGAGTTGSTAGSTGTTSGLTGGTGGAGGAGGTGVAATGSNRTSYGVNDDSATPSDGSTNPASSGSTDAASGSTGTTTTTAAPGSSTTVSGRVTTTTATTTTTPPSGSTTAMVTLHNTFAGAVHVNVGGQGYNLVSGQTLGPVTVTPSPGGNDVIEVSSAADPSCGVGDAQKYFSAGHRYQLNIVSGPVKCQAVDGPNFQLLTTG